MSQLIVPLSFINNHQSYYITHCSELPVAIAFSLSLIFQDFRNFPDSDMTLVGERGVCVSGGQKARISLARLVPVKQIYSTLAEVLRVARLLNGLSVNAVYPILLLYPSESPVPSLSCRNMLLGSLLCPLACRFFFDSTCKGLHYVKFDMIVAGQIHGGNFRKENNLEICSRKLT